MKRKDEAGFEPPLLRLIDSLARDRNCSIKELIASDHFASDFLSRASAIARNPILNYGVRAQDMFAYVLAALGGVSLINEEDSGLFFTSSPNMVRPDFRVITLSGEALLIEVKNFRSKGGIAPKVFKTDYLKGLNAYGEAMGLPVKLAIYWVGWGCWTLTDLSRFNCNGDRAQISIAEALQSSEMSLVGDVWIGAQYPLSLRFESDPAKPRSVSDSGEGEITIAKVSFRVADQEISDEQEKRIAGFLMFYGKWQDFRQPAQVTDGDLEYFEFQVQPEQVNDGQGFEIVGAMSEMISRQFLYSTSDEKDVKSLVPKEDVSQLGVIVPADYQGSVLKLWRLKIQPTAGGHNPNDWMKETP